MKTLKKFAEANGLRLERISYKFQGIRIKRKGWDLVCSDSSILVSFEPIDYRNGHKWILRNSPDGYVGPFSFRRVTPAFLEKIKDLKPRGIFFSGCSAIPLKPVLL